MRFEVVISKEAMTYDINAENIDEAYEIAAKMYEDDPKVFYNMSGKVTYANRRSTRQDVEAMIKKGWHDDEVSC